MGTLRKEVESLSREDTIIYRALTQYHRGECDYETSIECALISATEARKELEKKYQEVLVNSPVSITIKP